jgi:hypothetical protein
MADASLFEINLTPIVDEGGELRVKNRDGKEVQRIHLVDRTDALVVQADLVDVVHGKLSEKDAAAATLIVLDFTGTFPYAVEEGTFQNMANRFNE